jgi:hypothetical protein
MLKGTKKFLRRACHKLGRLLLSLVLTLAAFGFQSDRPVFAAGTNLLTNPGAEAGNFTGWSVTNGGSGWGISGYTHSGSNAFVSSYNWGSLEQEVDLNAAGYSASTMDAQPTIDFSVYVSGFNGGSGSNDPYQVIFQLRNASHGVVASYDSGALTATSGWVQTANSFSGYGTGVRYVYVKLLGKDSSYWGGQYGSVFDDASVIVNAPTDSTPPVISSVAAAPGQTTASVTWATDEASSSVVHYGTTVGYGSTAIGSSGVTSHSVSLSGLSTSTTYHYEVCSTDAASNTACSADATFTTNIASPVAVADDYSLAKNGILHVAVGGGVLSNDSGPGTLSAVLVASPTHAASFSLQASGAFDYVPVNNYVGSDSFTYKANNGYDSNTVTVTVTVSSSDSTVSNTVIMSRLSTGENAAVNLSFGLQNTLSTPLTVTFPAGFTVVSPFTSGTCSSGGTVDTFAMNAGARTLTAAKHNCSGTLSLSGAVVTNPVTPGTYIVSWVNDDPGSVTIVILGDDQVDVSATVDPTLTFDVGASSTCDGSFVSTDWSVNLGAFNTGRTIASSGDSSVKLICTHLSTNATSGAVVTVRNVNGANGLVSASTPTDRIPSGAAAVTSGTPNYGLCYSTVSGDNGADAGLTPAAALPDASVGLLDVPACTSSVVSGAESVAALSTGSLEVWRVGTVTSNAFAALRVKAAISATQPAHNDYSDALTFVATATF